MDPALGAPCLRAWALVSRLLLPVLLVGCTTVHLHPAGGAQVQVTRHVGWLQVSLDPGAQGLLVVRSQGLGLGRTPLGGTLGWWRETMATTGPQPGCHVVLWVDDSAQVARVHSLLAERGLSLDRVCVVDGGLSP